MSNDKTELQARSVMLDQQ